MFHWVTGIPFQNELHGGAYDDLTLWEQIDGGAQYTPAKKWLFTVPVGLYVISNAARPSFLQIISQVLVVYALHKLQPVVICCQSMCACICADPETADCTFRMF
jgi:hypothetical protein